jgi:hypothetical protein
MIIQHSSEDCSLYALSLCQFSCQTAYSIFFFQNKENRLKTELKCTIKNNLLLSLRHNSVIGDTKQNHSDIPT